MSRPPSGGGPTVGQFTLTGDSKVDADIQAFVRARQNILQKGDFTKIDSQVESLFQYFVPVDCHRLNIKEQFIFSLGFLLWPSWINNSALFLQVEKKKKKERK